MEQVILENDVLKVVILPEFGGKISEIWDKRANYQWLWTDPSRKIRDRKFGDSYESHDISGFDDCFPNIGISKYPHDSSLELPDHGDLWTQNARCNTYKNRCTTIIKGVSFNYLFERTLILKGESLEVNYLIVNKDNSEFIAFWSAHPLFNAVDGMQIELSGNPLMTKEFGFSGRMGSDGEDGYSGHHDSYSWPLTHGADGNVHDLSIIDLERSLTDKVVLASPLDGELVLRNPKFGCAIAFNFDPKEIPYVGICFNLNAWPFTGEKGCWLAIEPTQGATDKLSESAELEAFVRFPRESSVGFGFRMDFKVHI